MTRSIALVALLAGCQTSTVTTYDVSWSNGFKNDGTLIHCANDPCPRLTSAIFADIEDHEETIVWRTASDDIERDNVTHDGSYDLMIAPQADGRAAATLVVTTKGWMGGIQYPDVWFNVRLNEHL